MTFSANSKAMKTQLRFWIALGVFAAGPFWSFAQTGQARLRISNGVTTDDLIIRFNSSASNGIDGLDITKTLNGSDPQLYAVVASTNLSTNALTSVATNPSVDLHVSLPSLGNYEISIVTATVPVAISIEDRAANTFINLNEDLSYSFTESAGTFSNRFVLHFGQFWSGGTSSDWDNENNWSHGPVPGSSTHVVVPSGRPNEPSISGGIGSPASCAALTVRNGAELTVAAGSALTVHRPITNDGSIVIAANASDVGSLITLGAISGGGAFEMQQYLIGSGGGTPNGRFYYVGSPVVGSTALTYQVESGNKLWSANEATQNYSLITTDATLLNQGQGYVARMGASGTVTFSGTAFRSGNIDLINLPRTGNTADNRGYNLVSNPYPSSLNWSTVNRTNLEPTIWVRTGQGGVMVTDTYNATSGIGTNNNGSGAVTRYIPPTQAFWVRVSADGVTGSLGFENSDRSHQGWGNIYRLEEEVGVVRIALSNGDVSDEAIVQFNPLALDALDDYDSRKMWETSIPQLYSTVGNDSLTINGLFSTETNPIVDLGIKVTTTGDYTITASSISLNEDVWLEDRLLNNFQLLNINPIYAFTSNAGNIGDRFALHFGEIVASVNESASFTSVYAFDNTVTISVSEDVTSGMVTIMDMTGRAVQSAALNGTRTSIGMNVTVGVYLVRVETTNGVETHKVVLN
jgi:hypothetical protein